MVVDCEIDPKVVNAGIWKKISLTMITIQQLKQFRQGLYIILGNGRDALFDLMDAVLIIGLWTKVIPQQVIRDQGVTRIEDALRNAVGVTQQVDRRSPAGSYTIRGFSARGLRKGINLWLGLI